MTGYMSMDKYCHHCHKASHHTNFHKCEYICRFCGSYPICGYQETISCRKCCMAFYDLKCLENHVQNNVCKTRKRCKDCGRTHFSNKVHDCAEFQCSTCNEKYKEFPIFALLNQCQLKMS